MNHIKNKEEEYHGGNVAAIKLTNRQKLILSYIIKNSTITAICLAVITNIPQRTIEREIAALQKMSVLQRVGAPRTGKWAIKKVSSIGPLDMRYISLPIVYIFYFHP